MFKEFLERLPVCSKIFQSDYRDVPRLFRVITGMLQDFRTIVLGPPFLNFLERIQYTLVRNALFVFFSQLDAKR